MGDHEIKKTFQNHWNALSDIGAMHEFSYTVLDQKRKYFRNKECFKNPAESTRKDY